MPCDVLPVANIFLLLKVDIFETANPTQMGLSPRQDFPGPGAMLCIMWGWEPVGRPGSNWPLQGLFTGAVISKIRYIKLLNIYTNWLHGSKTLDFLGSAPLISGGSSNYTAGATIRHQEMVGHRRQLVTAGAGLPTDRQTVSVEVLLHLCRWNNHLEPGVVKQKWSE